jgi:heme A synthase
MDHSSNKSRRSFSLFAWAVLAYNIPVILWGAYVRASFSGDGCGAHWPFCNGQVIPQHMATPMAIEFTHRMMTSVDTFAVLALVAWAFLAFPKRHALRQYSIWSLVFLFIEALLGAGLVLFRYVAKDQSIGRVWYMGAHLTNTLLLLAALTATAWLASVGLERIRLADIRGKVWSALAVTVLVGITGAIAALGDTLFPAASLQAGMRQDFSSASATLLRLRMIHPLVAVLGAAFLLWVASSFAGGDQRHATRRAAWAVIGFTVLQLALGMVNLALLAPMAMQLIHLLMADVVWIAVVVLALEGTAKTVEKIGTQPLRASVVAK